MYVVPKLGSRTIAKGEVANVGVREIGCEQAQARDHSGPAPGSRPQVQDFDLQYVSRYGAFHEYWAAKGVQLVEVKLGHLGGGVTLLDRSGCDLLSSEMTDVPWLAHYRRSVRLLPLLWDR